MSANYMDETPSITAQDWLSALLAVATEIGYDGLRAAATGGPHVVDGRPATLTGRTLAGLGWPIASIDALGEHGPHEYVTNLTPAAAETARGLYEAEVAGQPMRRAVLDSLCGLTRHRAHLATPETVEGVTDDVRDALVELAHDPLS